jgi:peptidoglycan/LPS O-acetylase OafA/YrhL
MLKYYPQIDGLRGLAILIVIFFHYKFTFFSFGYLGVDIFFLISGFLITGFIFKNEKVSKIFFFFNFIIRRFLRLFPPLIIVVILSYIISIILVPSDNFKDFAQSASTSLFFISNFLYYFETGYFDQSSEFKPLLHTWSLSIEFQYYLIFALFCIFFIKFNKKKIIILSILIIFISIFLLFYFATSKDTLFYLTQYRIWEMLSGSIAYFVFEKIKNKNVNSIFPIFLLLFLSICIVILSNIYNLFNLALLITVILTFFFLVNLNNKLISAIFVSKFLVNLGKISYSLYLFHYPSIVFLNYYFLGSVNFLQKILCLFVSLLLATFSYHFVEKKVKKIKFKFFFSICLIFASIIITLFSIKIHTQNDFYQRYLIFNYGNKLNIKDFNNFMTNFNINSYKSISDDNINCHKDQFDNKKCHINFNLQSKKILLIGDSYAGNFSSIFNHWIKKNNYFGQQYTVGGCNLISRDIKCLEFINFTYNLLEKEKFDEVILSIKWNDDKNIIDKGRYLENTNKLINLLTKSADKISIMSPRLVINLSPQIYLLSPGFSKHLFEVDLNEHKKKYSIIYNYLNSINDNKIKIIDTNNFLCENDICNIIKDQNIYYKDRYHYTFEGSKIIFNKIFN